ncbi:MAG TPA: tetratricopeptide repeat protein [Acidobacteriota bacterium]|nr:tetratricopeptide repeat protein [Acidobacteriota bacterium]
MTKPSDSTKPADRTTVAPSSRSDGTETIGPYRILQKIGEGGMGDVYLAEQLEPVRRRVALKMIKHGMDTKQVVARFESERQALAMMDHPCIAKVFDAGATESGRPYFVMEFVQGIPITEYCDIKRLSVGERLELFQRVCAGVQHAHQKAIIHRDIKPSNVLVAVQDDEAIPKIIDFGVAKATAQRLTESTLFTELGQLIGTPEYMSPEQADMSQQDVDTRTDVYALGVVLYELLVGALPFSARELRQAGLLEIHRKIREEDPSKPSTRVSSLGVASMAAAAQRQTDPLALVGQLRGDLDWITMKALEKDRSRRYDSPAELAADLRRYLNDEPVEATPPSTAYRFGKFVRRHRLGVTGAATAVVVLIAFAATMSLQATRIARERDRANREAETARRVSQFMTGLFQVSDPSEARGNAVTAREILDQGVANIRGDLDDQPLIQAQLLDTMGTVYSSLGLYQAAMPLLERSLSTRSELLGDDDPQALMSKAHVIEVHSDLGDFEIAEQLGDEVLASRRRVLGQDHPDTIESMRMLVLAYNGQARYGEATDLLRQTTEASARVLGEGHPDTLHSLVSLGALLQNPGRLEEAEKLTRDALEVGRRNDGADHPIALTLAHNLASISNSQGRYEEAEALASQVLADRRRVLGEEHRYTLSSEYVLALSYFYRGRNEDVVAILVPSVEKARRSLGEDHADTLESMSLLGEAYRDSGQYRAAEPLLRAALNLRRRTLGGDDIRTQWAIYNLASLFRDEGRNDEAERLYLQTLEIELRTLGEDHPETAETAFELARIEARRGDVPAALEWLRRARLYGFPVIETLVGEPDFESLRNDPRFEAISAQLRQ